jgi:hypothetical protein
MSRHSLATTSEERHPDRLAERIHPACLPLYEGDRFVESMRYVRAYPADLPVLRDLLPGI